MIRSLCTARYYLLVGHILAVHQRIQRTQNGHIFCKEENISGLQHSTGFVFNSHRMGVALIFTLTNCSHPACIKPMALIPRDFHLEKVEEENCRRNGLHKKQP